MDDYCLQRSQNKKASSIQTKEASGVVVYLLEELGDARLRCAQLKKFIDEAVNLINKSEHRDHFFEEAAHLIYGVPDTLLRMDKALSAAALAASKLDYEEIKDELRPEKVEELEKALEEVRVKRVKRQSEEKIKIPTVIAKLEHLAASAEATGKIDSKQLAGLVSQLEGQTKTASSDEIANAFRELATSLVSEPKAPSRLLLASTLRKILADTINVSELEMQSRFEEGKPADPTENMNEEDAKKWWEEHKKNKDNFKEATDWKVSISAPDLEFIKKLRDKSTISLDDAKKKLDILKDIASLSSGTMSTLTGLKKYDEIASIQADFVTYAEGIIVHRNWRHWQDAWKEFESKVLRKKSATEDREAEMGVESRFEEGKPADPTQNMDEEDAKKWEQMNEEHGDRFKSASEKWKA